MLRSACALAVAIAMCLVWQSALANSGQFSFTITGLTQDAPGNVTLSALVGPFEDGTWIENSEQSFQENRDRNGHFNVKFANLPLPESNYFVITFGTLYDDRQNTIGLIALRMFTKEDISARGLLEKRLRFFHDRKRAFAESYPFSINQDRGLIEAENVHVVLRSIEAIISNRFVSNDPESHVEWARIYSIFHSNTKFFAVADSRHLTEILKYLSIYSRLSDDSNFSLFYARLLNDINVLDVGGRIVFNTTLSEHVFAEIKKLYADGLNSSTLLAADNILRTYESINQHRKCIDLARVIMLNLARNDDLLNQIRHSDPLIRIARNVMRDSANCMHSIYFRESEEKSPIKDDILGASRYLARTDIGHQFIASFRELFVKLENAGLMPRAGGRAIETISEYYMIFVREFSDLSET